MRQTTLDKAAMPCYLFMIFLKFTGRKARIGNIQKSDTPFTGKLKY